MNSIDSDYQSALDYIYSFVDYSLTRQLRYSPEKFDLQRMVKLMNLMGDPQHKYPIIHVAGTKGKGSTAALIESALRAAGYKVGLYTSPHLVEFTERIQVDRNEISKADLAKLTEQIKPYVKEVEQSTTFEITTALAFEYFFEQKVDIAVVEVGLGGRLDATNIISPLISVITSLSMDHMNILGNTLGEIAGEKAGIIKQGVPVVVAPQKDEAMAVVKKVAKSHESRLITVGVDFLFAHLTQSIEGQNFMLWYKEADAHKEKFFIPLLGSHQVENAATAYAVLKTIRNFGIVVSTENIAQGFSTVNWPARFEVLMRNPYLIVDSAHNPDSAQKLKKTILDYLPDRKIILVFGASEDKDVKRMFDELLPGVEHVITTQSIHPRAYNSMDLAELANHYVNDVKATSSVEEALKVAFELAGQDSAIVITGSIFVAAAGKEAWQKNFETRNQ